jgi:hypothetical protein
LQIVLINLLKELVQMIGALMRALLFLPRALAHRGPCNGTAMEFRKSQPDSDTLPLMQVIGRLKPGSTIWIIAKNHQVASQYLPVLQQHCPEVELQLSHHAEAFIRAKTVFLVNNPNTSRGMLQVSRWINRGQKFYRIKHGLVTKLIPTEVRYDGRIPRRRTAAAMDGVISQSMIDSYRDCYSNRITMNKILPIGFPRFYRAQQLHQGQELPVLPESVHAKLNNNDFRILYAPTRSGSLAKLPGFDAEALKFWLEQHNAKLYLKTHVMTRSIDGFEGLQDRVIDLSRESTIGSLDILSQMHALITDTSSIMMEAFALQKPVVHVLVDHLDISGDHDQLAYDENIAVPGLIARDFQSVMKCLEQAVSGDSQYEFANAVWHLVPGGSIDEAYAPIIR